MAAAVLEVVAGQTQRFPDLVRMGPAQASPFPARGDVCFLLLLRCWRVARAAGIGAAGPAFVLDGVADGLDAPDVAVAAEVADDATEHVAVVVAGVVAGDATQVQPEAALSV